MWVLINEIEKVLADAKDDLPKLMYFSDVVLPEDDGSQTVFKKGSFLSIDQLEKIKSKDISDVNIIFNDKLLGILRNLFPGKYRLPLAKADFYELDKYVTAYRNINKKSQRKRSLIAATELYHFNESTSEIVLQYGEKIQFENWNHIKPKVDKKTTIDYRLSEHGIIVFVLMSPGSSNYMKKFMLHSDLITFLVGRKSTDKTLISADFEGSFDVHSVNDSKALLKTYIDTNSKLIIVGEELDEEYKKALAQVKAYDPFARFMMATNIDLSEKENFIKAVSKAYNANNWDWNTFN